MLSWYLLAVIFVRGRCVHVRSRILRQAHCSNFTKHTSKGGLTVRAKAKDTDAHHLVGF